MLEMNRVKWLIPCLEREGGSLTEAPPDVVFPSGQRRLERGDVIVAVPVHTPSIILLVI